MPLAKGAPPDASKLMAAFPSDSREPTFEEVETLIATAARDGLMLLLPKVHAVKFLTQRTIGRLVRRVAPAVVADAGDKRHDVEMPHRGIIQLGAVPDFHNVFPRSLLFALNVESDVAVNATGVRSRLHHEPERKEEKKRERGEDGEESGAAGDSAAMRPPAAAHRKGRQVARAAADLVEEAVAKSTAKLAAELAELKEQGKVDRKEMAELKSTSVELGKTVASHGLLMHKVLKKIVKINKKTDDLAKKALGDDSDDDSDS